MARSKPQRYFNFLENIYRKNLSSQDPGEYIFLLSVLKNGRAVPGESSDPFLFSEDGSQRCASIHGDVDVKVIFQR